MDDSTKEKLLGKALVVFGIIFFTIWSSVVHAAIMAAQAINDDMETEHLIGDVPALVLVAAVLWYLSPKTSS